MREFDQPSQAGGRCPHCGALVELDDDGLAGKQTFDLIPPSASDDVLDDIELANDEEATLPFGNTVEFEPPSDQSTVDHIEATDLGKETTADIVPSEESEAADDKATVDHIDFTDTSNETQAEILPSVASDGSQPVGDPNSTMEFVGDATIDLDSPLQAFGSGDNVGSGGGTIDFDTDKTIDLAHTNPELVARLSSQWSGTFELSTPEHQTIRQNETATEYRSTLPVKSRSLRAPAAPDSGALVRPSDAPDYELLKMIGEGGMGVVYAARQSSIARKVAVKMLKPTAKVDADQRDKFISEAVVTGELDHPNIVPIYDLGSNEQGALFYSMKHVQGTPWDDVLKEKSLDENLNILLRVADAVAFAHARGVVHRDLKPENVMLGEFGEVLVMDWGLARVTQQFANACSIYQTGSLGGTPAYMAPEMARGPAESIDATSDIYLLGAMLYEIIGGRPPHSGGNVMKCLMRAAENVIDPIDYRGELLDVAMKAMCTDQANRYPTVKDFQTAVRTYLSHSESLVLTAHAEHHLADAQLDGDYKLFARALYGFQESLTLWPENTKARDRLQETEIAYARQALANDDLDLSESLLDTAEPGHAEVLAEVRQAQRERRSRQSVLKWTKRAVAALLLAIIGLGTYSYSEIAKGRREALTQRDKAVKQEQLANTNALLAAENEAVANANAAEAAENAAQAAENAKTADKNASEAERQRDEAKQQRTEAERQTAIAEENAALARRARESEEYEAYVASIGLAAAKIEENAYDFALELLSKTPVDRRHWEWGRLKYLCQLNTAVFPGDAAVDAVAYSPDGALIASGDRDGRLTVRRATTGEVLFAAEHGPSVYAVAFSPDGRSIATGSSDGRARVVSTADGQLRRTLAGHSDGVLAVAFSPDGRRLITSSYDNTARLWDLASGTNTATLAGHNWWVWAAEFSPDATQIVTASQDRSAIVWQQAAGGTYEPVAQFTDHEGPVYAASFSPDGQQIATAGYDQTIRLWQPSQISKLDIAARLAGAEVTNAENTAVLRGHTGAGS